MWILNERGGIINSEWIKGIGFEHTVDIPTDGENNFSVVAVVGMHDQTETNAPVTIHRTKTEEEAKKYISELGEMLNMPYKHMALMSKLEENEYEMKLKAEALHTTVEKLLHEVYNKVATYDHKLMEEHVASLTDHGTALILHLFYPEGDDQC